MIDGTKALSLLAAYAFGEKRGLNEEIQKVRRQTRQTDAKKAPHKLLPQFVRRFPVQFDGQRQATAA